MYTSATMSARSVFTGRPSYRFAAADATDDGRPATYVAATATVDFDPFAPSGPVAVASGYISFDSVSTAAVSGAYALPEFYATIEFVTTTSNLVTMWVKPFITTSDLNDATAVLVVLPASQSGWEVVTPQGCGTINGAFDTGGSSSGLVLDAVVTQSGSNTILTIARPDASDFPNGASQINGGVISWISGI